MALSPEQLLQKATLDLGDFGGAGEAPLTVEQVREFLRIAITPQDMLPDVRTVTATGNKWQESKIDFSSRIMRPGVGGTRLVDADRAKPSTGVVEISTVLLRGEVPVTDEVFEDQVEGQGFGNTLTTMIAEACGRDVEELLIQGDTLSGDAYLAQLDGWVKQAQGAGGNVISAAGALQDYQTIFRQLLTAVNVKFLRDTGNWRYWVPTRMHQMYRDILSARGTNLGDLSLTGQNELRYQGILIKPVAQLAVTAGSPDTSFVLFGHRQNFYAGIKREIRIETFRDPREGQTSYVVTARVDAKIAVVEATAVATGVNVEP